MSSSAPSPSSSNDAPPLAELLATPVQFLKGVGPRRAEALQRRGLETALDLLFFFPRDYQEVAPVCSIADLQADTAASVLGVIDEAELREFSNGRSNFGVLVRQDDGGLVRGVWFNQAFMARQLRRGDRVLMTGVPKRRTLTWEMSHPRVEKLEADQAPPTAELLPVYSLTEGLRQGAMRKIVHAVVELVAHRLDEVFPPEYLQSHHLMGIADALNAVHRPESRDQLHRGRRRLVYQELLVLQLAIAMRRWRREQNREAPNLASTGKIDARIRRLFPFELTGDQRRAIDEVRHDMASDIPMNRLLQGDVGTGKTVVAIYALLLAVAHQKQAALMAPTEVLARQHARTLQRSLAESRVRMGLLTGSLTTAKRRKLLEQIRDGEIDLVIGTHAIANAIGSDEFEFANLALVIVDEQHKFGVRQRGAQAKRTRAPLFGNVRHPHPSHHVDDPVRRSRCFRPARIAPRPSKCSLVSGRRFDAPAVVGILPRKLREGRQGYVVTPTVEEGETHVSAEEAFEELSNGPFEAFRLDLLHGRMSPDEKDAAMRRFEQGETQVLVCTSVVEVGIDVPNATLMTVEGGERFGLAQLHQLRGRIRRGRHPGFLSVFANPQTDEAKQRLDAFCQTNDGFELAELDYQLRGPGDLFSTKQHGLPPLRIADLQRDTELLAEAQRDARQLLEDDPGFEAPAHERLREMVIRRYGESWDLSDA